MSGRTYEHDLASVPARRRLVYDGVHPSTAFTDQTFALINELPWIASGWNGRLARNIEAHHPIHRIERRWLRARYALAHWIYPWS